MFTAYAPKMTETPGKSLVQQAFKPFHLILEDYLNGVGGLPEVQNGSFQFDQECDVDFSQVESGHHDIFSVASGNDPLFDPKPVDAPSTAPSSDSSSSPEVSE